VKVIGVTGGIASGKSTVMRMFAARGASLFSADEDARAVLSADSPILEQVFSLFPSVRREDGTLDRAGLATIIFANPADRERLEALTHPAIFERMQLVITRKRKEMSDDPHDCPVVFYEVPLLFEKKREGLFDAIIAVYAPPEILAQRLQAREKVAGRPPLTEQEIAQRLAAQLPVEEKARRADFVIRTDVPLSDTEAAVDRIFKQLTQTEALE
jgi:dephospho-CoA kinase